MSNVRTTESDRGAMHLSEADLERLRRALAEKRDSLVATLRARLTEERSIHDAEPDLADDAENVIEQDTALRLGAFDAAILADVERALAKLEDGRYGAYGISEESGAPIPIDRLEAIPWARRTAEEEERRMRAR